MQLANPNSIALLLRSYRFCFHSPYLKKKTLLLELLRMATPKRIGYPLGVPLQNHFQRIWCDECHICRGGCEELKDWAYTDNFCAKPALPNLPSEPKMKEYRRYLCGKLEIRQHQEVDSPYNSAR